MEMGRDERVLDSSDSETSMLIRSSGFRLALVLVALCCGPAHAADRVRSTHTAIAAPSTYDNVPIQSGAKATHPGGGSLNAVHGIVEDLHPLGFGRGSPSGAAGNGRGRIAVGARTLTRTRRGGSRGRFITNGRYFKDSRLVMTSPVRLDACSVHGNGSPRVRTQLE